ncbi:MAG: ABC transporter ATP-binding protein, partial [Bacteroidota bacterium]
TVLLVSHDRAFLDNVVSSTLVFEGEGQVNEYVGGYADWQRQTRQAEAAKPKPAPKATASGNGKPRGGPSKLSYKEQRELDALPAQIEALETEQVETAEAMAQPDFHERGPGAYETAQKRMSAIAEELEAAFERWEALETKQAAYEAARA